MFLTILRVLLQVFYSFISLFMVKGDPIVAFTCVSNTKRGHKGVTCNKNDFWPKGGIRIAYYNNIISIVETCGYIHSLRSLYSLHGF